MDMARSPISMAGMQSGLYQSSLGSPEMPHNKANCSILLIYSNMYSLRIHVKTYWYMQRC